MTNKRFWSGALIAAALCVSAPVFAEGNPRLEEAQRAYSLVDYEGTRSAAKAGIEQGGNDATSTAELYLLWGTAAAALDQTDEARVAFTLALAANPELKLDRSVSPKIRGPYQEARGNVTSADGKAPLELTLQRKSHELLLTLRDRPNVAVVLELSTRTSNDQSFSRRRFAPSPSQRLPLPEGAELQYFLRVLDKHDNVLFEGGSADEPRRLALTSVTSTNTTTAPPATDVNAVPYYITAGSLAVLGLAAGGVATAMYLRREDAAKDWNGAQCERPGATRREQCAGVDDRRKDSERLAIGFAAAGGAFIVGSVVSLLLAPSSKPRTDVALGAAPGTVALRLRATF